MPKPDQEEIELQANEMVKAGLAEEYSGKVVEMVSSRKGEMRNMERKGVGYRNFIINQERSMFCRIA